MSEWGRVIAYALITAVLGVVLRELGFRGTRLVMLIGTVSLIGASVTYIGDALSLLPSVQDGGEYAVAMLKIVGVGYAFGICSDVCRELGESGVANAVGLVGRVETFLAVLPYFEKMIELGAELLK